jgi:hypothetical protein
LIETVGLGAGSYPEPNEVIDEEPYDWDQDDYDDYNMHYADEYHELEMLGEL